MAATQQVRAGQLADEAEEKPLSAAMLSVYYHSLGRQLELRGAPAMLLVPAVRPMPLEEALGIIERNSRNAAREGQTAVERAADVEREALWTMLRSTPPPPFVNPADTIDVRYSAALRRFAPRGFVEEYDGKRARYRSQSTLFSGALIAYARNDIETFDALRAAHARDATAFNAACAAAPFNPQNYLDALACQTPENRERCQLKLQLLEDELGMSLQTFVNDLADATAFMEMLPWPTTPFVVFPTAAVVVQDAPSLTVRVTATSLVTAASLEAISTELDPQNWSKWSDVFTDVRYVEAAGRGYENLRQQPEMGKTLDERQTWLLREKVGIMSGLTPTQIAEFENVLGVGFTVKPDEDKADLRFWLERSLRSRYLWDERPGGILIDEGFTKVRPVFPTEKGGRQQEDARVWRVTIRKALRFADRTPASWGDSPLQFGQSLNYLAPATLAWWLQSDIYNAARHAIVSEPDAR